MCLWHRCRPRRRHIATARAVKRRAFRQEQKHNVPHACQVYLCMIMVRRAFPGPVRTMWDHA
ncbi:hypothetical protein BDI4_1160004 [Burkholderia diffusa]|nr:hypothetical protein BDI4_1160004 [Burkholderia diffusa]